MYVSDSAIFSWDGQFVNHLGVTDGKGPGEFVCSRGLAVDDCGVVYVCDAGNNHVQAF